MDMQQRVKVKNVEILSDDWYVLKKNTFEYQRSDGSWQTMSRETYDRGNGATILLYNKPNRTVVLIRQFRFPAFVNGHQGMMIEACAGLLDERDPVTCIKHETEEETGYRLHDVKKVLECYMSPGSVTERLFFFIGEYDAKAKVNDGGGLLSDGEDIDVVELPFEQALEMIQNGEIVDAKTIMLLQYAQLNGIFE